MITTKESITNFERVGYAEVFIAEAVTTYTECDSGRLEPRCNEAEVAEYLARIATIDELETAYASAVDRDGSGAFIRGVLHVIDYAGGDLRHKARIFRPDNDGLRYYVEPVFGARNGRERLIDLIWSGGGYDDGGECRETESFGFWGFSTGYGAVLGGDNLDKRFTESEPLHVYETPEAWREAEREGVVILKLSARALLRRAAFVELPTWGDVTDIVGEHFRLDPHRVAGPQDADAFAAWTTEMSLRRVSRAARLARPQLTIADMPEHKVGQENTRPRHWAGPWFPGVVQGEQPTSN